MSDGGFSRGTGLLVLEVVNSNPNGDPDNESDPRTRAGNIGEISPVSVKRKLRDLIADKDGPVWKMVSASVKPTPDESSFEIFESRGRKVEELKKLAREKEGAGIRQRFWDARIFGCTFLQEGRDEGYKRTGVVQFGMGISVAPVDIQRLTLTVKAGVEKDKTQGMAPMGYRVVQHGVYCVPFFVNPSMASKSGCTKQDIDVLLSVLPHAYTQTASFARPEVRVRHAWYAEHRSPLGSCADHLILEALAPKRMKNPSAPSTSWADYDVPVALPKEFLARLSTCRDLVSPSM